MSKPHYKLNDKNCINCLIALNTDNIRACDLAQANYICKSCRKLRDKQRYETKKEIIRWQQKEYDLNNKIKVIIAYGGKCNCCNESNYEFLIINHTNNKQGSGGKLYRWLIKNNFPKDNYQLLCYNCNFSKGFFGYCPHNKINT